MTSTAYTSAGTRLFMTTSPVPDVDMDVEDFTDDALTWVEVANVGNVGEGGVSVNFPTYNILDKGFAAVAKGVDTPTIRTVELARLPGDPGQEQLRDASATRYSWAFRIERNDAPNDESTGTIEYIRGLVGGPGKPGGGSEDFVLETYQIAAKQREITVEPAPIVT